jgi:hypothetical protein
MGEPLAGDAIQNVVGSLLVVDFKRHATVVAEIEVRQVAMQMLGLAVPCMPRLDMLSSPSMALVFTLLRAGIGDSDASAAFCGASVSLSGQDQFRHPIAYKLDVATPRDWRGSAIFLRRTETSRRGNDSNSKRAKFL